MRLDNCYAITDLGYELVRITDNEGRIAMCDVVSIVEGKSEYKAGDTTIMDLLNCLIFSADEYGEAYMRFKQINEEREYKSLKEYYK